MQSSHGRGGSPVPTCHSLLPPSTHLAGAEAASHGLSLVRGVGTKPADMGKMHKKHKYEEFVEKPLSLVLKVGGNEVTKLSTGSSKLNSGLFEDKNNHGKHKYKKQTKRKKVKK